MPTSLEVTTAHRADLVRLSAATVSAIRKLWPGLDVRRLDASFPAWFEGVQAVIQRDVSKADLLAEKYLRSLRAVLGVGDGPVVAAELVTPRAVESTMWASTGVAVKSAMLAGVTLQKAAESALVLASGAASRLVLDSARSVVTRSAVADPRAAGWRRTGRGACPFCAMLISRGAVYNERSVRFSSHSHCRCSAEPVYAGRSLPASAAKPPVAKITDTDRASFERFLAKNPAL